jgi:hypothetical protein
MSIKNIKLRVTQDYSHGMKKSWEMVVLVIIFTDFCVVFLDFVLLFDIFLLFIDSAFRLIYVTILPLTISANYRLSSQVLSVDNKMSILANRK